MKKVRMAFQSMLLISMIVVPAIHGAAQHQEDTEISGFFQQYGDFSYKTGISQLDISPDSIRGGGFSIAQNIAPWFAMWTQVSFFGAIEQPNLRIRIISNLQGIRYQTPQYGPLRIYGKGGLGFARFSFDFPGGSISDTKFSVGYGAGAHLWAHKNFGFVFDLSHVLMGLPNLTDLAGREKWDSGLVYSAGLTIKF